MSIKVWKDERARNENCKWVLTVKLDHAAYVEHYRTKKDATEAARYVRNQQKLRS